MGQENSSCSHLHLGRENSSCPRLHLGWENSSCPCLHTGPENSSCPCLHTGPENSSGLCLHSGQEDSPCLHPGREGSPCLYLGWEDICRQYLPPSALFPQAILADRYSMKPCWVSPGCRGHCSQNSRDALFFLCERVLSGPQISRTCLRSSVTHQKSCLPRAVRLFTLQVTSLWSLIVRIVL